MKRIFRAMANSIAGGVLVAGAYAQAPSLPPGSASGPWSAPTASLARRVAGVLGPGPVQFALTNLSSISADDAEKIRLLLQSDLQASGIILGGADSANTLRITLSENSHERLWVAEIIEGTEKQVVMEALAAEPKRTATTAVGLTLSMQTIFTSPDPILAALPMSNGLVLLEPSKIVVESRTADDVWKVTYQVSLPMNRQLSRDPRGLIVPSMDGTGFSAYSGGAYCQGTFATQTTPSGWSMNCMTSDDPWPLGQQTARNSSMKAFYNATRDFFTGVVTPGLGVDLPGFYSAVPVARPGGGEDLLLTAVDGRVLLAQSGSLTPVAGARDWGSDIAALRSGCGTDTQLLASGSGAAASDSLRAYRLPGAEVVPASAPLAMNGTVTALGSAADGTSAVAIVHTPDNQYEVDRVSAQCN
ncbi:MAG TPA: hypothetical protein VFU68_00385 [Terracidiphilus sp.]|nr:hypothetical protein [Terracidiphilus sp.]